MPEDIILDFAARSDIGRRRQSNEDAHLIDDQLGLFVVCDGMGGHAAGEVASEIASRTLHGHVQRNRDLIEEYVCGHHEAGRLQLLDMLEAGVNLASSRVFAKAALEPDKRGMGTTLVGALVIGAQAFIVHVGDSRLYLLRNGKLEQVTEDHNAYNELVKRRGLPAEQVVEQLKRNRMTRAVGIYEWVEPDTLMVDLADGDRILLCSDGLSRYFDGDAEELGALLAGDVAEKSAEALVRTANDRGGADNVTAIVIEVRCPAAATASTRVSRIEKARALLTRIPLFKRLDQREQLHILQIMHLVKTAPDEVVIEEGAAGDCFYIAIKGAFRVQRKGNRIRTLAPGEHFGEMALIQNRPRTATVVSEKEGELLAIRREDFYAILRRKHRLAVKILWAFSRTLASRLEEAHLSLDQLRDEGDELSAEFLRPPY